jgi:putative aldouronate transport system permease protein
MKMRYSSYKRDRLLYLMLLPGLCWFLLFKYVPMYGLSIAFRNYNIFQGFANAPFAGLSVFRRLFGYADFWLAFRNTLILSILKLLCGFPIPILLSLMINEIPHSIPKKIVQTAVLLPNFISWVVMGSLIYIIFSPNSGVIRSLADFAGFKGNLPNILTDKNNFRTMLVWSDIWKSAGYGTIVYLGVITGIDSQLYEAAEIDGAGWLRRIWHITLAGMRSTIIILLIFRMGALMNVGFEQIFVMSNPLVRDVSEVLDTYVYKIGMTNRQYSMASAAGLIKSVIGLLLVLITNRLANRIEPGSGIM